MPRGILPEVKLHAVKDYISGNGTHQSHASNLGVNEAALKNGLTSIKHSENPLSSEQVTTNHTVPP